MSHNYLRVNTAYNIQAMSQWGIENPEDIILRETIEGIQRRLKKETESAKTCPISRMVPACFIKIAEFLGTDDIPAVCGVNRLFAKTFIGSPDVLLKAQINSATRITSVKQLKAQAVGMQKYFPREPAWKMSDVLRIMLPNLKALDFSEVPTLQEIEKLLSGFEELATISEPLREKKITETVIMRGDQEISQAFPPEELQGIYKRISESIDHPESPESLGSEVGSQGSVNALYHIGRGKRLLGTQTEGCLKYLRQEHPNYVWGSALKKRTVKVFADICHVNFGNLDQRLFSQLEKVRRPEVFLESFCPNLSHFSSAVGQNAQGFLIDLLNNYEKTLVYVNCYKWFEAFPDVSLPIDVVSHKLEYLSLPFAIPTETLKARMNQCPKLKNMDFKINEEKGLKAAIKAIEELGDIRPNIYPS